MINVFTYGTLKKGYRNHILLARSEFIQSAVTKPKYKLYDCGSYPCMVKSDKGVAISGEVYKIDAETLKRLDILEGVPYLYNRNIVELEDCEPALAYFYQEDISDFEDCGTSWPRKI